MADGTPDDDGPTLAMPSFPLRRRRRAASPEPTPAPEPAPGPARRRRLVPTVTLGGLAAAVVTGVAVGALAVALGWLAGAGCEVVRGTSSCGGGPGLVVLVVVLAVLAWAGGLFLRVLGVPHPGSTSLLGVGILAVLVLAFLLGSLDAWWALVAVPVAGAVAYAGSWWVTTAVGEEDGAADDTTGASYDVR